MLASSQLDLALGRCGCIAGLSNKRLNNKSDSERSETYIPDASRWWQWPNLLGLDAPIVAVSWQLVLSFSRSVRLSWEIVFSLGAAVWAIYVIDRILDGPNQETPRHLFARRHKKSLIVALLVVTLPVLIWIVPSLPGKLVERGLWVTAFCLLYLIAVQAFLREIAVWRSILKRLAMSILFASGVILPFWNAGLMPDLIATAAVVCGNIALTDRWESHKGPSRLLRVALAGGGALLLAAGSHFLVSLALGCWLMLSIDIFGGKSKASKDAIVLCALADASLAFAAWVVLALR